jgi:peptidoglycan hydrolase CwlO-like protein
MISNMERKGFVKKLLSTLVVAAIVIGCGVVGCGSPTSNPAPSTTKTTDTKTTDTKTTDTKTSETKFEGKFESMDQDKGTFTIKVDDKDKEFKDVKDLIKDFKKDDYKKGETKVKVTTDKDGKATKIEKM